jgi:type IV pilus assembly protein PilX
MNNSIDSPRISARQNERGVVLFVALIVLVIMALAGVAMMRQSTSSVSVAGNLAFRQNAMSASDLAIEAGRVWFINQSAAVRNSDLLVQGYHSSWGPAGSVDPSQLVWDDTQSLLVASDDTTGNEVRVMIHRLCETPNLADNAVAQKCVSFTPKEGGSTKTAADYSSRGFDPFPAVFFRVTARVLGPKNTVSYTQVVLS